MKLEEFENKILHLIANDDLDKAIEQMAFVFKANSKTKELVVQNSRYNELKRSVRLGVIDWEQADVTKNRIRIALVDLLADLKKSYSNFGKSKKELDDFIENNLITNSGFVVRGKDSSVKMKGKYISGRDMNIGKK